MQSSDIATKLSNTDLKNNYEKPLLLLFKVSEHNDFFFKMASLDMSLTWRLLEIETDLPEIKTALPERFFLDSKFQPHDGQIFEL